MTITVTLDSEQADTLQRTLEDLVDACVMTITVTLDSEQADTLQRALEDLEGACSDHYNALAKEGAAAAEMESARKNHRRAANLANHVQRLRAGGR